MQRRILSVLMTVILAALLMPLCVSAEGDYTGKLIILHTNDIHGEIDGYAYVAAYKKSLEDQGADVLLADSGDFSQGSAEVDMSKGAVAVELMNAAGYDVAAIGNHEFDPTYDMLKTNLAKAWFKVICANLYKGDERQFDANTTFSKGGVKVGFFGLLTPETMTVISASKVKGFSFWEDDGDRSLTDCAQKQINQLHDEGADIVICLSHIGTSDSSSLQSTEVYRNTNGLDFIIDAHSHTTMTEGDNGEPIQSTGTKFKNIGMIVIDETTKKIESNKLIPLENLKDQDADVQKIIDKIHEDVKKEYGVVIGKTEVELNGERAPGNRTEETNMGDLVTDAIRWFVTEKDPDMVTKVPNENVLALINGGSIRASIHIGDVTRGDVHEVLPFGNVLQIKYIKGKTLLNALEASTFSTPEAIGAFPQVCGIHYTIDCTKKYDAMESTYPQSTYYGPKSIRRVSIQDIGGKPFDPEATYAVVTNDFIIGGGDTYYEFAAAVDVIDTGYALDMVLFDYITEKLGGVVGAEYASPKGRITEITEAKDPDDHTSESPATGDATDMTVGIVLCSAAWLVAVLLGSKRKSKN